MQGILLDQTCSIWRKVLNSGGVFADTKIYPNARCLIVPVSRFDQVSPFAYESTHIIWVAHWLVLRQEDAIHWGRRVIDQFGNVDSYVYVINGRRPFRLGIPQQAYYAREMA